MLTTRLQTCVRGFKSNGTECSDILYNRKYTSSYHVYDPALEDPVGELLVVPMRDSGGQLLTLAKLVGSLLLGTICLRNSLGRRHALIVVKGKHHRVASQLEVALYVARIVVVQQVVPRPHALF